MSESVGSGSGGESVGNEPASGQEPSATQLSVSAEFLYPFLFVCGLTVLVAGVVALPFPAIAESPWLIAAVVLGAFGGMATLIGLATVVRLLASIEANTRRTSG